MDVKVCVINGRVYINTTPHPVNLVDEDGNLHVVEPSGVLITPARWKK